VGVSVCIWDSGEPSAPEAPSKMIKYGARSKWKRLGSKVSGCVPEFIQHGVSH